MSRFQLGRSVSVLRAGGVIAYPTEAVFGLGCDPWNPDAVQRLLDIKQRPVAKGLILIAANFSQLQPFLAPPSPEILDRVMPTWPGPNTWIMPASDQAPAWITGQHQGIAVRVSAHPRVIELCLAFGAPIVSTSANFSGAQPARSGRETRLKLGSVVDNIVIGEVGGMAKPTVIRDALSGRVLRPS